ncbi:MAG: sulfurtransferase [Acidimicrobiales bacterium]|jgi:thiosulfate/3-mercaptopyruvate sulfurtransferase
MTSAKLISADQLFEELQDPTLRILDATTFLIREFDGGPYTVESGRASYEEAHIPGALFADIPGALSDQDSPYPFTLPSLEQFSSAMADLGVGEGTRVVTYAQASPMWATRLWWMLRYFGFDDVRVFDGGLLGWRESEFEVSSTPVAPQRANFVGRIRPELLATKDDVLDVLGGAPACLVNALPTKAFVGNGPGAYSRPGRIPGSISLPSVDLLDAPTGPFRPIEALQEAFSPMLLAAGDRPIIAYCGGGISATVDVFGLALLGHDDVKLYDGSLTEWSANPSLPLEVG